MSNRIDGPLGPRPPQPPTGKPTKAGDSSAPDERARAGATSVKPQDSVALTDTAARLQQLEAALKELPVVDARRVAELRQTIEDGSHRTDPQRVADKLLELERLLGPGK